MSKHAWNQNDTMGYFLPEDSHVRLKTLHAHMVFLSQLAQPRKQDEEEERVPEIRVGELALCQKLLAEQAERVLEEAISPAEREAGRQPAQAAPQADTREDGAQAGEAPRAAAQDDDTDEAGGEAYATESEDPFVFGLTLDQADELDRLHNLIYAHGDMIFSAEHGDLAVGTLSSVGHAVFDDAIAAKAIMDKVASQKLHGAPAPRHRVREEPAVYAVSMNPGLTSETALPMLPSLSSPAWQQEPLTRH